jgi:hypothetical protein
VPQSAPHRVASIAAASRNGLVVAVSSRPAASAGELAAASWHLRFRLIRSRMMFQFCSLPIHHERASAIDRFKEKLSVLPIEVMVVLAINVVVAALGYYAVTMWGLFN